MPSTRSIASLRSKYRALRADRRGCCALFASFCRAQPTRPTTPQGVRVLWPRRRGRPARQCGLPRVAFRTPCPVCIVPLPRWRGGLRSLSSTIYSHAALCLDQAQDLSRCLGLRHNPQPTHKLCVRVLMCALETPFRSSMRVALIPGDNMHGHMAVGFLDPFVGRGGENKQYPGWYLLV